MKPKIKIIGAGPAGIFAAYSLAQEKKFDIEIIDQGKDVEKRVCAQERGKKCVNCQPCNIHQGFGGAGTMSDGKLNFDIRIGNNLNEITLPQTNRQLTQEVENFFISYGITPIKTHQEFLSDLEKKALQNNIEFLGVKHAHIGSENLRELMKKIKRDLTNNGVTITTEKQIQELNLNVS